MDKRMEDRAITPRYTVTRAAELIGRPPNTIRRLERLGQHVTLQPMAEPAR